VCFEIKLNVSKKKILLRAENVAVNSVTSDFIFPL